ncbi:PREDICTED: lymphoid-specific helicase-like [Dinoponera quadriceps]|uniref:Lymphoid-specific helicase-like n=1 Tax=Dinoponera quadriceps TaxID=609295 RepID=A0A6P3YA70_DINQU|nr:PREDICTED: lymphoid-specific helicase-like [Dinoponera quadriceps]
MEANCHINHDSSNLNNSDSGSENRSSFITNTSIANDVKFSNIPLTEEKKPNSRKRQYSKINLEKKSLMEEQHKKEMDEQKYKALMHLLSKSQFYSSYILTKIEKSVEKEKNSKKMNKSNINKENKAPSKKENKRANLEKYDIRKYIPVDVQMQIETKKKRKLNLSTEEIEAELQEELDVEEKESLNAVVIVSKYFVGKLRDYQQDGLQWLKVLYENGLNGILADEMGLGKTIQVIALLCHLIEKQQAGPYLIIAPLSTIPNWMLEFERFAPDIPVVLLYGSKEERSITYPKIKKKYNITSDYKTQPVVITTFEMPLKDIKFLQSQTWRYIVIDEGHRIKNYNCLLIKALKTVKSMNRLLLTGTPLQNNLSELWSLLNFLLPEIFDDLAVFESWFDVEQLEQQENTEKILRQEEEKRILSSLREILKPFMLRRLKSEVCLEVPPKKELVVYAPLTQLQHDLYQAVLNRDIQTLRKIKEPELILPTVNGKRLKRRCVLTSKYGSLKKDSENADESGSSVDAMFTDISYNNNKCTARDAKIEQNLSIWKQYTNVTERNHDFFINIQFQNRMVMYKKIVNHPYLVHCPLDSAGLPKIDEDLVKSSGKLLVLDAMLGKLKAQKHKVLLFSTMVMILNVIEDYLSLRDYKYVRLDGSTDIELRKEYIDTFNNNKDVFLFLISTRAGGVGLNLAAADTVIIYDSDWNPQVDIQAMARCHRIGQTQPVVIYKLCTKGTIDEAIMKRSESKRILEKIVISKNWNEELNRNRLLELKQLLKSKEYKIVTSEKEVFTEVELNQLLDRSDLTGHQDTACNLSDP